CACTERTVTKTCAIVPDLPEQLGGSLMLTLIVPIPLLTVTAVLPVHDVISDKPKIKLIPKTLFPIGPRQAIEYLRNMWVPPYRAFRAVGDRGQGPTSVSLRVSSPRWGAVNTVIP